MNVQGYCTRPGRSPVKTNFITPSLSNKCLRLQTPVGRMFNCLFQLSTAPHFIWEILDEKLVDAKNRDRWRFPGVMPLQISRFDRLLVLWRVIRDDPSTIACNRGIQLPLKCFASVLRGSNLSLKCMKLFSGSGLRFHRADPSVFSHRASDCILKIQLFKLTVNEICGNTCGEQGTASDQQSPKTKTGSFPFKGTKFVVFNDTYCDWFLKINCLGVFGLLLWITGDLLLDGWWNDRIAKLGVLIGGRGLTDKERILLAFSSTVVAVRFGLQAVIMYHDKACLFPCCNTLISWQTCYPKSPKVYAWSHDRDDPTNQKRHVTVLHIGPITSPEAAVRAASSRSTAMPVAKPKVKPIGRPKLPKGHAKSTTMLVRMSEEDRRGVEAAAKANGQTVSEWLRTTIYGVIHV